MSDELLKLFTDLGKEDEPEKRVNRENYLRAPFGWPGGKARQLDFLLPLLPVRSSYIEPFGGSGAVLLSRQKSPLEVFNDRHSGIVAFYRCIRDLEKTKKLVERLTWCLHSREEFLWCKETWNSETIIDDIERAARWYYMVLSSFSKIGGAFARITHSTAIVSTNLPNQIKEFERVHMRMRHVQIENLDFRLCLKDYDHEDAVYYLDPPYLNSTNPYIHTMSEDDHKEMCDLIFKMKGFVALSGYENDLYKKYPWDDVEVCDRLVTMTPANVTHMPGEAYRDTKKEFLWIKKAHE